MNPDKFFDYLDGRLPEHEREVFEDKLLSDPQMQRQLGVAREIHKGMRSQRSREVLAEQDPETQERAGRLGRRVAVAFAVLVFVNVLVGIAFIVGRGKSTKPANTHVRDQVSASLERAAAAALPAPTIADDITILAAPAERDALADRVIAAAAQVGGSGVKALPNERTTTVVVELPVSREPDFRAALVPLGAPASAPTTATPAPSDAAARKLLQVQIMNRENAAAPTAPTP